MAVIIIAILITALVVPLFAGLDLGDRDRTYTNVGLSADLAEGEEVTLNIRLNDAKTDVIITINGTAESYPVDINKNTKFYFISYSAITYFYVSDDIGTTKSYVGACMISQGSDMGGYFEITSDGLTIKLEKNTENQYLEMTATCQSLVSGDLLDRSWSDTTKWMLYPSKSGDYVMYGPQVTEEGTSGMGGLEGAWAKDGSILIWAGYNWTGSADTSNMFIAKGNPYDISSISGSLVIGKTQAALTLNDLDSIEVLEEEDGVKKFGNVTEVQAYVEYVEPIVGAPKTIFIPGDPDKKAIMSMIDMIPLLLMVGLVVGVVGAYRMRGEAQR